MAANITPEVVEALELIRAEMKFGTEHPVMEALKRLDDAGVFELIDEATGYSGKLPIETTPACTCEPTSHRPGCPADPAEWGDMARGIEKGF